MSSWEQLEQLSNITVPSAASEPDASVPATEANWDKLQATLGLDTPELKRVVPRADGPSYISPSALSVWFDDPEKYYVKYRTAAGRAISRGPGTQTAAMGLGSAFDRRIKLDLMELLGGRAGNLEITYDHADLIDPMAQRIYEFYLESGAYLNLVGDLKGGVPFMEDDAEIEIDGVRLFGKPDLWVYFRASQETLIIDWKVSGFFDQHNMHKPAAAAMLQGGWKATAPFRCGDIGQAKGDFVREFGAVTSGRVSKSPFRTCPNWSGPLGPFESISKYAAQLTMYRWLAGQPVGREFVVGVEVILPGRILQYRTVVPEAYQVWLFDVLKKMWIQTSDPDWRLPTWDAYSDLYMEDPDSPGGEMAKQAIQSRMMGFPREILPPK